MSVIDQAMQTLHSQIRKDRINVVFESSDMFVVPEGVASIRIFAVGASGGSGNGFGVLLNNGGDGGAAVSNVKVNPGESLEIFVGERGQDGDLPKGGAGGRSAPGFEGGTAAAGKAGGGGGGGGASGVTRVRGNETLIIAGGGGGGSGVGDGGVIGRGSAGGSYGTNGQGLKPAQIHGDDIDDSTRGGDASAGDGASEIKQGSGGGGGGLYGGSAGSDYRTSEAFSDDGRVRPFDSENFLDRPAAEQAWVIVSYDEPKKER